MPRSAWLRRCGPLEAASSSWRLALVRFGGQRFVERVWRQKEQERGDRAHVFRRQIGDAITFDSQPQKLKKRQKAGFCQQELTMTAHSGERGLSMTPGSSQVFEFDGNAWDSTISFDPGIGVTLAGSIELVARAGGRSGRPRRRELFVV